MSDVTNIEKDEEALPEGAIGRLEPDPELPEIKIGKFSFNFIVTSDGVVFPERDRPGALLYEEAVRESRKAPGA